MINVRVYFIHHGQNNFFFIFNLTHASPKKNSFSLFWCWCSRALWENRPPELLQTSCWILEPYLVWAARLPSRPSMAQGNPTLPYKLLGRPISSDTPVLVFVPGFPDRCESFEILASHFASTHSLILACLPDYDQRSKSIGGGKLKRNR